MTARKDAVPAYGAREARRDLGWVMTAGHRILTWDLLLDEAERLYWLARIARQDVAA